MLFPHKLGKKVGYVHFYLLLNWLDKFTYPQF